MIQLGNETKCSPRDVPAIELEKQVQTSDYEYYKVTLMLHGQKTNRLARAKQRETEREQFYNDLKHNIKRVANCAYSAMLEEKYGADWRIYRFDAFNEYLDIFLRSKL